jgi:long-chain acyl-CoA synthetase
VTAGGKNVAPAVLEDPLRAHPLISQAVVIGDRKPFVGALISLDPEMLPIWLANNGGDKNMSVQDAGESELVRKEIQHAIDRVNRHVSQAESIRKFEILPIELSEGSGHVTPSMKVKRSAVASDFAEYVDRIYGTDDVDTMANDIKG